MKKLIILLILLVPDAAGAQWGPLAPQGGTLVSPGGTANRVAKFSGAQTIVNSQAFDDGTGVSIGSLAAPTTINAGSSLFPSAPTKVEVLTGSVAGAYNELFVIRHANLDATAVTRRLGLMLKLSSEGSSGESAKQAGLLAESTSAFANSTALHLVTNDVKRISIDSAGLTSILAGLTLTGNFVHNSGSTGTVGSAWSFVNGNVTSFDGRITLTPLTSIAADAFVIATAPSAATVSLNAETIAQGGTFNTTSGTLTSRGLNIAVTSTRSSGANNLQNFALQIDASGGQVNQAIRTGQGDVVLNAISGNTTIGAGTTSSSTFNFNGRETVWQSAPIALTVGTSMMFLTRSGTFDTTSGSLTSGGLSSSVTSTRSAGANNLQNFAVYANASGAQVNRAIVTDNGDVALNVLSGTTAINATPDSTQQLKVSSAQHAIVATSTASAATSGKTAVNGTSSGTYDTTGAAVTVTGVFGNANSTRSAGANDVVNVGGDFRASGGQVNIPLRARGSGGSSGLTAPAGTVAVVENTASDNYLSFLVGTSNGQGINFGNTTSTIDGNISYTSGRALQLRTGGNNVRFEADVNGSVFMGDAGNSLVGNNVDVVTIGQTGTGQTTASLNVLKVSNSGSYDTTAGAMNQFGIRCTMTSTRSAGANNLQNICGSFDSSGAQVNFALTTLAGDVVFNSTSGNVTANNNVTVGDANTDQLIVAGHVRTTGTAITTGDLSACGTTPSVGTGSTDMAGKITEGTTATGCTLTFKNTYTTAPFCTCTGETSGAAAVLVGCSTTATTLVITNASASNDVIYYNCVGP